MFAGLAQLLKECPSFQSEKKQWKHFSHKLHLLVTLKYFGSEGIATSFINVKDSLGIGKGSVLNYVECTIFDHLSFDWHSLFFAGCGRTKKNQ
jgi:hypothetical protein